MLQPVMHILKQKSIILASGSPRRRELLELIGLKVNLCPAVFKHYFDPRGFTTITEFVEATALQKVLDVRHRLLCNGFVPDIIIGADTVVTLDGMIVGKATNADEAYQMLSMLSGRTHTVYTGVVIKTLDRTVKFTDKTDVIFKQLNSDQIARYVASGEAIGMDAGYWIKGGGAKFVEKVVGDYFTVVGLPLFRLCTVLYRMYEDCT